MNSLKIAWLFPDTLYLHGERGNVLALERFGKMAKMDPEIAHIDFKTEDFNPMDYDIIFCPPGEISSFKPIIEYLSPYKGQFETFVEEGRVLIATGTSMALWGKEIRRTDGSIIEGLGICEYKAIEKDSVYGDDNLFVCKYNGEELDMLCSQIQMVDIELEEQSPFGHLIYGYGNTGQDTNEGYIKANSIFTNCLGPMLVTNPWLTMEVIKVCGERKGIDVEYDYDCSLEKKSFQTKKNLTMNKKTRLTNCQR